MPGRPSPRRHGWPRWRMLLVALLSLLAALPAAAQPRVALIVGVAAYQAVPPLANPANDAADIGAALGRLGFQTEVVIDPDRATLEQAVRRFGARARGADAALFFYAGHAVEAGGRNWLLPRTADITSDRDLRFEALDADGVLEQVEGAARVTIVLLDACRDNPFRGRMASGTRSAGAPGLAPVRAAVGTLIAFATAPGTVAEDGRGRNSPFTAALLQRLEQPGVELRQLMAEVRRDVREATGGRQVPWEHSSLEGAFYFKPPAPASAPAAAPRTAAADPELLFWDSIRGSTDAADFRAYLERFPQGTFAPLARNRLAQLAAPATAPAAAQAAPGTAPPGTPGAVLDEPTFAAAIPHLTPAGAAAIARLYLAARPVRALAVNPERRASWRFDGLSAANAPRAAELVLERCQVAYGSPCVLVAVDDRLQGPGPGGAWTPRDMPQLAYSGPFDPALLPGASAERRAQPGLRDYGAAPEPKAIAHHPSGGTYVWSTGAASQHAAEADALGRCNADPVRAGRDGPCLLYAVGNRVVLPARRTEPMTPVAEAAVPPAPAPPAAAPPASGAEALPTQLRTLLARGGVAMSPERIESLAAYAAAVGSKALAVEPAGGGLYRRTRRASPAEAEQLALEGCQIHYGRPCVLLAVDEAVQASDLRRAPRRDMPRVRHLGRFAPEQVPMVPPAATPAALGGYAARPTPKAIALSASPPGFFIGAGASPAAAEAAAMAECAAQPPLGGPPRCRLYALGDRVVLPERRPRADAATRPAEPAAPR